MPARLTAVGVVSSLEAFRIGDQVKWHMLVIVVSSILVSIGVTAQSKWDFNGYNPDIGLGSPLPTRHDAAFYRSFARPRREKIRHSEAGGTWALETDQRTRISYPRVGHLASGKVDAPVNEALTSLHGQRIRWTLETDKMLATNLTYLTDRASVPPRIAVEPGGSTTQTAARITYFSKTTLSVVDMAYVSMVLTSGWAFARGVMVDIKSGAIFDVSVCNPDLKRPMFTFGPLLKICSEDSLTAFFDLWQTSELKAATRKPTGRLAKEIELLCNGTSYISSNARFTLYLSSGGLAVHDLIAIGSGPTLCVADPGNPYNPVVIPYKDLAPLMTPGPLRDELLALPAPVAH